MTDDEAGFIDAVYGLDGPAGTRALYGDWAASYEAEVAALGYVTPGRSAAALAAHAADLEAPILDLGCGTGLSGAAFRAAGFTTIDGSDFSAEMLALAAAKAGLYRKLALGDLDRPIPAAPGEYAHIAAVGVFSPGHAPAAMIGEVLDRLAPGGCFVFSLNDHAIEEKVYRAAILEQVGAGTCEIVFDQYGEHLVNKGVGAEIVVLRRR